MIKVSDVVLPLELIAKSKKVILTEVGDAMEYVDGKSTGKRLGSRYACVAPANKYNGFTVKVEDIAPAITQEELDKATEPVMVTFEGFEAHFYRASTSGEYLLTAKAQKIVIQK